MKSGKIVFDHSKLLGKIKEMGMTQEKLAEVVGIAETTMSAKLTGKSYFDTPEIDRICEVLDISAIELSLYFFTPKV